MSGGNIQKLILARELSRNPSVLVAAQPTRGLDVSATEYVHRRLIEQRAAGTATLLISEDLDEILNLSDRIAVIYEGRIMDIVERENVDVERIGLMMAGVSEQMAETTLEIHGCEDRAVSCEPRMTERMPPLATVSLARDMTPAQHLQGHSPNSEEMTWKM